MKTFVLTCLSVNQKGDRLKIRVTYDKKQVRGSRRHGVVDFMLFLNEGRFWVFQARGGDRPRRVSKFSLQRKGEKNISMCLRATITKIYLLGGEVHMIG